MGFNLKEKLKEVRVRNLVIIVSVLMGLLVCGVCGFEYYRFQKLKSEKAQYMKELERRIMQQQNPDAPKKPSEYQIGIEYTKAVKGKKPVLALFYADWCGYCIRFMPVYQELSEKYADAFEFSKVNVEDQKYEKIVNEIGITGFPTVYIIDPKYDNKILLSNGILGEVDTVSTELDRFLRIRKLLDSKKK